MKNAENERFDEEDVLAICYRTCNSIRKYYVEGKLDIDDDEYESIRYYLQEDLLDDDDDVDDDVCVKVCETSINMQKELKQIQSQIQKT
ncbi:MAG: hypothetical protein QXV17_13610 [Candidatus Micrarchaeaceae archaeon]